MSLPVSGTVRGDGIQWSNAPRSTTDTPVSATVIARAGVTTQVDPAAARSVVVVTGGLRGPAGVAGPQGPPGSSAIERARVQPLESPDGMLTTFTLPDSTVISNSVRATLNGLEENISVSGNHVTFPDAPHAGDLILCDYQVN